MDNKTFKQEVAGALALLIGVITVLTFCLLGNPNALGEYLFWLLALTIFTLSATIFNSLIYKVLTKWERRAPRSFAKMKRNTLTQLDRFNEQIVEDW